MKGLEKAHLPQVLQLRSAGAQCGGATERLSPEQNVPSQPPAAQPPPNSRERRGTQGGGLNPGGLLAPQTK